MKRLFNGTVRFLSVFLSIWKKNWQPQKSSFSPTFFLTNTYTILGKVHRTHQKSEKKPCLLQLSAKHIIQGGFQLFTLLIFSSILSSNYTHSPLIHYLKIKTGAFKDEVAGNQTVEESDWGILYRSPSLTYVRFLSLFSWAKHTLQKSAFFIIKFVSLYK